MRQDAVYESKEYPTPGSQDLNLIDGAAVRTNPIPAFFEWCKRPDSRNLVQKLERSPKGEPSLHVVYNVPLGYEDSLQNAPPILAPDIVESAMGGLQLEKRRDTRQEVRQMNYTSELESIRRKITKEHEAPERGPFVIFADEIAPQKDIQVRNDLNPKPEELMGVVAEGCRSTMETLYRVQIMNLSNGQPVSCISLLSKSGGRRIKECGPAVTGLPEVCKACTKILNYKPARKRDDVPVGLYRNFGAHGPLPKYLSTEFKHLSGGGNVVFLGSGGVFRGSFHIGVIAALTITALYPDLVIGASVGALMGGALCHITASSKEDEIKTLEKLANLFLRVDDDVALTRTLKSAAKQLGIRSRSIRLSPSELSRMVRQGSKSDAGYAVTGAPPALLDAISYLFAIPHKTTIRIASEFVAGHITESVQAFLGAIRRETLSSFEIRSFLMGTSLLEARVRELLGEGRPGVDLTAVQPYHQPVRKKVSFFGTTSFLNAGVSLLLGRDFLTENPSWDATYMGLSSSAFPAVFAPRSEADLLPGRGRADRYFADGGLFDNLPFFPAIEVLAAIQESDEGLNAESIQRVLRERVKKLNLFISAGLNAVADEGGTYATMRQISERASTLGFKSKTESFSLGATKTVSALAEVSRGDLKALDDSELLFLKTSVPADILSIWPSSQKHLNGTFAFCRSLGLKQGKIQKSIADGCFRTLFAISSKDSMNQYLETQHLITRSQSTSRKERNRSTNCPFFRRGNAAFQCPFTASLNRAVAGVKGVCSVDKAHVSACTNDNVDSKAGQSVSPQNSNNNRATGNLDVDIAR
jgi:predicted acylesterase/phospholipase RssA